MLRRRYISQSPNSAQHRGRAHAEIALQVEHVLVGHLPSAEFFLDDRPDLGGRHQEAGRERLGEFLPGMGKGDKLIAANVGVVDERALVAVLEVMAVFVGGGEGLAAGWVGAVDQGKGGFFVLEEDEGTGELGSGGDGQPEDAAAVELGEGEDIADGLVTETEAAAFLLGQALGGDVGVEGRKSEATAGAGEALEEKVIVAVSFEALEDGAGGFVQGVEWCGDEGRGGGGHFHFYRHTPKQDVEGAFFLLEEVADVFPEDRGDLVQGGEGGSSFIGLEKGDELGGEAERAADCPLGEAQFGAGFFELGP